MSFAPAHPSSWPRTTAARWLTRARLEVLGATVVYLAFAIYLTWPLAIDLDTRIYGAIGDLTGAMSIFRETADGHHLPFLPGTLTHLDAPNGLPIRWTLNIATWPSTGSLYLLTVVFGPIAAFGLYILAGFTATGVAMFLFVRRYIASAGVAFIAGWAYAFYPFPVVKAQGHVDFVHGWVLVIVLWRLVALLERPDRRNGVWLGLALILAFSWTPYHILFAGIAASAFGVAMLVVARRRRNLRSTVSALAVAAAIGVGWMAAMTALNLAAPRSEVRTHTLAEVYAFSARWKEYVVPTSEHPLVGGWADRYRLAHYHGSNLSENMLYLGVTLLVLALIGLISAARARGEQRAVAFAATAMGIVAFACSAPPKIAGAGLTLPTPTLFLFHVTTTWRVFSRLGVIVMLATVVLASIGIARLARGRPTVVRAALLSVIFIAVAGDLCARPPVGTNKLIIPPSYTRFARMPPGIAAEYPLVPAEQSNSGDIFYQGWHHHPLLNGYPAGSPEEARALRLTNLSDPHTADGLAALGVRYVLLRQDIVASKLPDPGKPGRGFRLVSQDGYIAIYRVTVRGPQVLASPATGFLGVESGPRGAFQWLGASRGTIDVRGSCSPCSGTLDVPITSFATPRDVTFSDGDGRILARARHVTVSRVRVPVRFSRHTSLHVDVGPGPLRISDVLHTPDTRSVSVGVGEPVFVPGGGRHK